MTNKLTVEEIAKQIREEVATGKYGFVKAVSRALEKHARQEVEEATKPLVEVIKRVEALLDIAIDDKSVSLRRHTAIEAQRQLREALAAHYEKYPKRRSHEKFKEQ